MKRTRLMTGFAAVVGAFLSVATPATAKAPPVREHRNLAYRERERGEIVPGANLLDLYLPPRGKDFPVVVLVHGGCWVGGDKVLDFIPDVARCLARQGIVVAAPNYRLAPPARHPAQARDVARAVAWVRDHVGEYGGRTDQLFLMGHSAGGHLVSLLAADGRLLRESGVRPEAIKGVISVSGVYRVTDVSLDAVLKTPGMEASLTVTANPFTLVFGADPEICRHASPLTHVRAGMPPFLIAFAEHELPTLADMAADFDAALREHGCPGRLLKVPGCNHVTVLWRARHADDPLTLAVLEFIRRQAR
jgi:acetyl esterase/lipase